MHGPYLSVREDGATEEGNKRLCLSSSSGDSFLGDQQRVRTLGKVNAARKLGPVLRTGECS